MLGAAVLEMKNILPQAELVSVRGRSGFICSSELGRRCRWPARVPKCPRVPACQGVPRCPGCPGARGRPRGARKCPGVPEGAPESLEVP
eukprot:9196605-Pyramimonas_sp.AAC.1